MNKKIKQWEEAFVGAVLTDEKERIYLIKEDDKNKIGKNRWNLPGGSIDGDETLEEAIYREVLEETGCKSDIKSVVGCYLCKKGDSKWIYIVFDARLKGKPCGKTDPGIEDGRWFSKDKFLHMEANELVHPDMQLVYNLALQGEGVSLSSVKFINYDIQ